MNAAFVSRRTILCLAGALAGVALSFQSGGARPTVSELLGRIGEVTFRVGAFLVGNLLKGPRLWPRYSPNKTWAGFVGGLLSATVAAVAVAATVMRLSLVGAAVIGLAGGLGTMAGDLWESMLKRRFGVKDSGDLIPGHGGVLDRVDGLMFAVMVFAVARLVVKFGWAH